MVPEARLKIAVVGGGVSGGNGLPFPGPVTAIPRSSHADVPLPPENRLGPAFRVGYSDLGVNRRRVDAIRSRFDTIGKESA